MKLKSCIAATVAGFALTIAAAAQSPSISDTGTQQAPSSTLSSVSLQTGATGAADDPLARAAAVYATYQSDVSKVNAFQSTADIDVTLSNLGGQNHDDLARGWIAYAALIAAQNGEFQAAVRDVERHYGRDRLVRGLQNDARYARMLNGADNAVRAAITASNADAQRLRETAAFVKDQAYSLQSYGWAKDRIANPGALADRIQTMAMAGRPASAAMFATLTSADASSLFVNAGRDINTSVWERMSNAVDTLSAAVVPASYTNEPARTSVAPGKEQIADRIATLAAYRVLGADRTAASPVPGALDESFTSQCMEMAQLNLQQCLVAAHKQFEIPFCVGEHALAEVGDCLTNVTR